MFYSIIGALTNFLKMLLVAGILLVLSGCGSRKHCCVYLTYEEVNDYLLGGELSIELVAATTWVLEKKFVKGVLYTQYFMYSGRGNPYFLMLVFSGSEEFQQLNIRDAALVGFDSGDEINLSESGSREAWLFHEAEKHTAIVVFFRELKEVELNYEDYDFRAILYLHQLNGEIEKREINYRLKTEYKITRNSK